MKKFLTPLLSLLIFNTGIAFSSLTVAQTNTCQEQKQQDIEQQIYSLQERAKQNINEGKITEAQKQLTQAREIVLKLPHQNKVYFLNQLLDNDSQDAIISKLVKQVEPSQKTQTVKLLTSLMGLAQSLDTGYSFAKARNLTLIASYWSTLAEPKLASQTLAEALQASKFVKGAEFQTKVLTPIAKEYLTLKQPTQAEEILERSLSFAKKIATKNSLRQSWILEPIASTYAQLGKTERALQIAQSVPEVHYRSQAHLEIVRYLAKVNKAEALKIAQKVESSDLKGKSLLEVALAEAKSGQSKQAAQIFATALQTVNNDTWADYRKSELIQIYAKSGQKDAANAAAQELQSPEYKAVTLGIIANQYSKAGQLEKADQIITQIIPLIQTPEAVDTLGYLQYILTNALTEKQYQLAFDLVKNAKNPDFRNQDGWFLRIADAAIKEGKPELVLEVAQLNNNDIELRNKLLQKVAISYAQKKQISLALDITKLISNSNFPYQIETSALITISNDSQTSKLLQQIITDARKLESQQRTFALASIARQLFKNQNYYQQGNKLLDEAIGLAKTEKDDFTVASSLQIIEELFIAEQQYFAASKVVQTTSVTEDRDFKLSRIAQRLIEQGYIQEVINIINILNKSAKTPETKTGGLITIADTEIRNAKIQAGVETLALALIAAQTIPDPESRTLSFGVEADGVTPRTVVDDDSDRASSLEKIAFLYAKSGYYNDALGVAKLIQDKTVRNQLIQKISCYKS